MNEKNHQDNRNLINFWDKALSLSEEDQAEINRCGTDGWKELAPSEKLFNAAASLGHRKKVLDYGCGTAWAAIIAAKYGCPDVTAVDAAPGAVRTAAFYASLYGLQDAVHTACISSGWLQAIPACTYDGLICSNVLDVVPPETAEEILRDAANAVTEDASVIIGLNFSVTPEAAAQRGIELTEGNRLYMNGVLRLVSRSDEEWAQVFSSWFAVERLDHFAWPGEAEERRRLFFLRKKT